MKLRTSALLLVALGIGIAFATHTSSVVARVEVESNQEDQQEREERRTEERLENQDARMASRAANLQVRCQTRIETIASRLRAFSANHNQRVGHFSLIATSLSKAEVRLSSAGADTMKLKSYLVSLETQITALESDVASYRQQLQTLSKTLCTGSVTENREQLAVANALLQDIKKQRQAIAQYIKTVIRPEIVALRQQLKPPTSLETEKE